MPEIASEGNIHSKRVQRYAVSVTNETVEQVIQNATRKIATEFDPEKIILFGSWAWGTPGPDSDVDLFVVKETDNTRELARQIDGALFPRRVPIDILVYTPSGLERRLRMGDFFVRDVVRKGKTLYERR